MRKHTTYQIGNYGIERADSPYTPWDVYNIATHEHITTTRTLTQAKAFIAQASA